MMKNFWNDENGQGMVEYALIIALIALVIVGAVTTLGTSVKGKFEAINGQLGGGTTNATQGGTTTTN